MKTKLKNLMQTVGIFAAVYIGTWVFGGSHGHTYFMEPAKQNAAGEWTCQEGDGPFQENGKGTDPVCHIQIRQCPVLLFPIATESPCPYRDFLGGRWTDDDEYVLRQMKQKHHLPFF